MTLSRFAHITIRAAWLGVIVLLLALLTLGCSQTRTVTVPAQETSVQAEFPDTIEVQELPPPPPTGHATRPEEVIVYGDTSVPTFDVSLIEVDRTDPDNQEVRIRVQAGSTTVEKQLAMPPVGEGLRVQTSTVADDTATTNRPRDTPLQETVFGSPIDYEVEADVSKVEPPWWRQAWRQFRLVLAFAGGFVFALFLRPFIPGL